MWENARDGFDAWGVRMVCKETVIKTIQYAGKATETKKVIRNREKSIPLSNHFF